MSAPKILVICSNYYPDLAKQHLESCIQLLDQSTLQYEVEEFDAGTHEIPFIIQHFHRNHPFDAYLPLSLLVKGSADHYDFIFAHIKECFIQFAREGILLCNSGIISASSMELLRERVENKSRIEEAIKALEYLLRLKQRFPATHCEPQADLI